MSYIGLSVNDSPTIAAVAKEEITDARGKCVKFDEEGDLVVTTAQTDVPVGIITLEGPETIKKGMTFSVQVKDMGVGQAGEALSAGDLVAGDADGLLKKATSGYAIGQALEKTNESGAFFDVQIFKTSVSGA